MVITKAHDKKIFKMFENNKKSQSDPGQQYLLKDASGKTAVSPTLEQYNNMQDILQRLYPNNELK